MSTTATKRSREGEEDISMTNIKLPKSAKIPNTKPTVDVIKLNAMLLRFRGSVHCPSSKDHLKHAGNIVLEDGSIQLNSNHRNNTVILLGMSSAGVCLQCSSKVNWYAKKKYSNTILKYVFLGNVQLAIAVKLFNLMDLKLTVNYNIQWNLLMVKFL